MASARNVRSSDHEGVLGRLRLRGRPRCARSRSRVPRRGTGPGGASVPRRCRRRRSRRADPRASACARWPSIRRPPPQRARLMTSDEARAPEAGGLLGRVDRRDLVDDDRRVPRGSSFGRVNSRPGPSDQRLELGCPANISPSSPVLSRSRGRARRSTTQVDDLCGSGPSTCAIRDDAGRGRRSHRRHVRASASQVGARARDRRLLRVRWR